MKEFIRKNPPRFWFLVGLVLIFTTTLTALSLSYLQNKDSDVLAVVAGKKITTDDLGKSLYGLNFDMSQEYDEETKELVLNRLIEREIATLEAGKMGISVSDKEIELAIKERLGEQYTEYTAEQKDITKEVVRLSLLINKIRSEKTSTANVTYLVARFDRGRQEYVKNWNQTIEKDKVYAKNLIDGVYQKLIAGTLNAESAIKLLDNDPRIGRSAWSFPQNMTFSKEMNVIRDIEIYHSKDMANNTLALNDGINKPLLANIYFQEDNEYMDSFYYIPIIKDLRKSEASYEQWLEDKKVEYNVRSTYDSKN